MINYQQLKIEFIRELRKDKSQKQLSNELGYSFNQVSKWETQSTQFKWSDFCAIANQLNVSVLNSFKDIFKGFNLEDTNAASVIQLLKKYNNLQSSEQIAVHLDLHPAVVRRWLKGISEPEIEDIFKLLNLRPNLLGIWLSKFVDPKNLPAIKDQYELELQRCYIETEYPFVVSVRACFELIDYLNLTEHNDEFMTKKTGLSLEQVKFAIEKLKEVKLIEFKNNKYIPDFTHFGYDGYAKQKIELVKKYWTEQTVEKMQRTFSKNALPSDNDHYMTLQVASMSKETSEKIKEKMVEFNREILKILEQDRTPPEELRVLMFHSFNPEDQI